MEYTGSDASMTQLRLASNVTLIESDALLNLYTAQALTWQQLQHQYSTGNVTGISEDILLLFETPHMQGSGYHTKSTIVLMICAWVLLIVGFMFCCCSHFFKHVLHGLSDGGANGRNTHRGAIGCFEPPPGVKFISDKQNDAFLRTIAEEDLTRQKIRAEAIQFSDQNPFFKAIRQNDVIAREVAKLKRLDVLEQKRLQRLQVDSAELRQLNNDLHKAEIITWLKDKRDGDCKKQELRKQKDEEYAQYKVECDKRDQEDERRLEANKRKISEVKDFVVNQIAEKHKNVTDLCKKRFVDRKRMLDFVASQDSEDIAKLEEIERSKKQKKAEWDAILAERAAEREKAKKAELAAQLEFLAMGEQQAEERLARMEKAKYGCDWRNERAYKIGLITHEAQEKKRMKDEALIDLLVGEKKMREDIKAAEEVANKLVKARELLAQNKREMDIKYLHITQPELKEQAATLEQLRRNWAENDRKAMLKEKDYRSALYEVKRVVAKQVEEKKAKRAASVREATEEADRRRQADLNSLKEIQAERIRLLKQAPKEVLLNMHPDALRSTEHTVLGLPPKKRGRQNVW